MKTSFRKFLKLVLLIIFVGSFAMFAYNQYQSIKAKNAYDQAESIASETTMETTEITTEATTEETTEEETKPLVWQEAPIEDDDPFIAELLEKNLEALREVNPDVMG